jgi:hypothetical protein
MLVSAVVKSGFAWDSLQISFQIDLQRTRQSDPFRVVAGGLPICSLAGIAGSDDGCDRGFGVDAGQALFHFATRSGEFYRMVRGRKICVRNRDSGCNETIRTGNARMLE